MASTAIPGPAGRRLRRAGAALVVTLVVASACTGEEVGSPSGSSSTTVADGIAFETAAADQVAPGEESLTEFVVVTVDLPPGQTLTGTAVVALEDVTLRDAAALELERVELPVEELVANGGRVEVLLPLPLDGSLDINAAVHIDVDQDGLVTSGDWISPDLRLVTPDTVGGLHVGIVPV